MGEYPGPITKSFPTAADETEMAGKAVTTPPPTVGEPELDGRGREENCKQASKVWKRWKRTKEL